MQIKSFYCHGRAWDLALFVCLFHRRKLVKFPMEENNLYRPKARKELRGQWMASELKNKQEAKPGGYVDEAQLIPDWRL